MSSASEGSGTRRRMKLRSRELCPATISEIRRACPIIDVTLNGPSIHFCRRMEATNIVCPPRGPPGCPWFSFRFRLFGAWTKTEILSGNVGPHCERDAKQYAMSNQWAQQDGAVLGVKP